MIAADDLTQELEPISFEKNKMFYSISEVAEKLGVNESAIRFWEKEFPDIITPKKNAKGTRAFTRQDIKDIQLIHYLLKVRKFTIDGAKKMLSENKRKMDQNNEIYRRLILIRDEIRSIRSAYDQILDLNRNEKEEDNNIKE